MMPDANWPTLLTEIMDRTNLSLQQGNRQAAAANMAQAAELLFLQATKAETLDDKERFVKRATDLLETSVLLYGDTPAKPVSVSSIAGRFGLDFAGKVIANARERLHTLTGLEQVKTEVTSFIAFLKIQNERKKQGLNTSSKTLHYVFTGNPGTGKTTVARILAKILYDCGILQSDKLTETDRSGLVAGYIGQTAGKTDAVIQSALDGVLFIDEAYSLQTGGEKDFGQEAVNALLKRMEDYRDRLVVIVAGYTAPMNKFLKSNPGLSSRFTRFLHFEDYSAAELLEIFLNYCNDGEYRLTTPAREKLLTVFEKAIAQKDEHFGNGRYVRNVFEETIRRQSVRLSQFDTMTRDQLLTIDTEDMP